jgi:hypothetical protein
VTADIRPALSICVATTTGWPAIEPCLRSFLDDGLRAGAEILVADGSGGGPPDDPAVREAVTWCSYNERSVFRLVELNLQSATGEIVALTEDHCTTRPGWVEAILRAHREHPKAAAIGGAIENGTTGSRLEWASYLMTQSQHMAPLHNGPAPRIANEANVSFKRARLERMEPHPLGFMTIRHLASLAAAGAELVNDDRIIVDHHESLSPRATSAIHFDDGRTISGFRRRRMGRGDWARLAAAPVLPLYRSARVARTTLAKRRGLTLATSLLWIAWLEYCHAAGESVGYLLGEGRSPYGLR